VKHIYNIGDTKHYQRTVTSADVAAFDSGTVHDVYATFALARDAEWTSRLFVLDMKEEHEEGIGTFVNLKHVSPAFVGDIVSFTATIDELAGNAINCSIKAAVGTRTIAEGRTGQKVLPKEKIEKIFDELK
jgi:predicted thioesterase